MPRHRLSELLVAQAHSRSLHGGPQLTLSILRQQYWILNARNLVKQHIRQCVKCVRVRAETQTQLMGDLPAVRTTPSRPFNHTGVDYAGPLFCRLSKGRGHQAKKCYISLFVCLATKAIHLELVTDYSSEAFLASFHRFVGRRRVPSTMYSDNGTNFHGANKELQRSFMVISRDPDLHNTLSSNGTAWRFIPPAAPHFGGLWEAGVKSVKQHLCKIVGSNTLTIEEMTTLLVRIEACLNSRLIAPLTNDPDDLTPLTSGHFLIGGPILSVPEPSVLNIKENRLFRWQMVHDCMNVFGDAGLSIIYNHCNNEPNGSTINAASRLMTWYLFAMTTCLPLSGCWAV